MTEIDVNSVSPIGDLIENSELISKDRWYCEFSTGDPIIHIGTKKVWVIQYPENWIQKLQEKYPDGNFPTPELNEILSDPDEKHFFRVSPTINSFCPAFTEITAGCVLTQVDKEDDEYTKGKIPIVDERDTTGNTVISLKREGRGKGIHKYVYSFEADTGDMIKDIIQQVIVRYLSQHNIIVITAERIAPNSNVVEKVPLYSTT